MSIRRSPILDRRALLAASAATVFTAKSSLGLALAADMGSCIGGWDNATLPIDGIDFPVQHAWAIATYGAATHLFPCFGGSTGAECYPGTTNCANPAPLFRLSDWTSPAPSNTVSIDMVLAILVCTGIRTTDPYKWRLNYDCTTKNDCRPPADGWCQGESSGIVYGINGVCHQAANRILAASNGCADNKCSLDLAKTYASQPFPTVVLSWLTYGPLGWDIDEFWPIVQHRYYGGSSSVRDDEERLVRAHFARSTDIALRRPIISRFILNGSPGNTAKTRAVEQAIQVYLLEKLSLDSDLVTGAATPHAFAPEVNRRAAALLKRLGEIVGEDWYRKHDFPGAVLNFVCPAWMAGADDYRRFAHLAPARPPRP